MICYRAGLMVACLMWWLVLFGGFVVHMTMRNRGLVRSIRALLVSFIIFGSYVLTFAAGFSTHFLMEKIGFFNTLIQGGVTSSSKGPTPVFYEAWQIIDQNFLGNLPSTQERSYGAIRGMITTLDDPYTLFIEPQPRQLEKDELRGEFGGIGVYITIDEQDRVVLRPMEGRAAALAGVQEGDILIAVDGQPLPPSLTTDDVALMVRGDVGTPVKITIQREGSAEPLTFEIVRQRIETPSVEWHMLDNEPDVGYIAIHIFNERTNDEFVEAVEALRTAGMQRLMLDLRHNPGGLVDSAVSIASQFLKGGIVFKQTSRNAEETTYPVRPGGIATDIPLVVLIDGTTASAAEIVAGALQDAGRARLVGERTFGKGSVQSVRDLSDQSSVHVTTARWYTPSGRQIDQQGLQPDVEIARASEEDLGNGRDPVLEGAMSHFSG